ncbi:DUF4982 domain-containing protein [Paenibacillus andongensis]|uniref:DUF4982 domain-containing protein n=1 Tax=Paenibacillus andongensis TaxID=2975482 RepID=UPI0021BA3C78|nr:DUF4982 domain-containing protein [Paenibacillus andongensis]
MIPCGNSHLISDFTWTGWDYLGEAGVGRVHYDLEGPSFYIQITYPWLTAWVGDNDIIGNRKPVSYYREIVFGLRKMPYIAVQRPEPYSRKATLSSWGWSDSISSWSWKGHEGQPIKVKVYADAEEVELLVNGKSVGKAVAGEANRFKAEFDTVYEAGEVTAVAYVGGRIRPDETPFGKRCRCTESKCRPDEHCRIGHRSGLRDDQLGGRARESVQHRRPEGCGQG